MHPTLAQPCAHMLQMLAAFAASLRSSQPTGAPSMRWARAVTHLDTELQQLRMMSAGPVVETASLKSAVTGLTQLARTQDGLRFEHAAATPAAQLADERRLVVFAAWQLLQALEHAASMQAPETTAR